MKQKKKAKICFVIYIAGFFFKKKFCYEVIVKQFFKERPANYYSRQLPRPRLRLPPRGGQPVAGDCMSVGVPPTDSSLI
jgi:hypothetical protein